MMLAELEDKDSMWPTPLTATPIGDAAKRLEAAALDHNLADYASELQRALRISPEATRRVVEDNGGESVVVTAKALAIPSDMLVRILLVLNPNVAQSVERVFALVKLSEELTPETALRMVSHWRRPGSAERVASRHRPVLWDDETAKRGKREGARRSPASASQKTAQPSRPGKRAKRGQETT
jgi:hypothetical protein